MPYQTMSVVGALLILGAYTANQRGWAGPDRLAYNGANLAGALLLTVVAVADRRVGFILLEATWALVTLPPLIASIRTRTT